MKKVILLVLAVIIIPFLIVTILTQEQEIQFYYLESMNVRVKREQTNNIELVPFEDYVVGVLAGEMPVSFDLEALKAQSVAARTYVMKKMIDNRKKNYDVVDTVTNQVYISNDELKEKWGKDYTSRINKVKTAVVETKGQYLTYDDKIIDALFFSTSVGQTENSEDIFKNKLPYLQSVNSAWDEEVSPVFKETSTFTREEFYQKLKLPVSKNLKVDVTEATSTGRIKSVKINNKKFTGGSVQSLLSLRSTFFDFKEDNNKIIVTTKGYGHGVGMSQYGALAMAKKGYKYDEILKHYYQGVEIKKI